MDAVIRYDCPFTGTVHLLVMRNALYVPAMDHNLLTPFLLRAAGLIVKNTPKKRLDNPQDDDDNAITFEDVPQSAVTLGYIFVLFVVQALKEDVEHPGSVYVVPLDPPNRCLCSE